jgi:hypothetical protein
MRFSFVGEDLQERRMGKCLKLEIGNKAPKNRHVKKYLPHLWIPTNEKKIIERLQF